MLRINRYLDALTKSMSKMDSMSFWPLRVEEIAAYFTDLEAEDLHKKMNLFQEKGVSLQEAAKLFHTPSFIREILPDLIIGSKFTKLSREDRIKLPERFFDLLEEMHSGDIFCDNGKNLILSKEEVSDLVNSTLWIKQVELKDAQKIHRLSSSLLSLMWTLYFYPWPNMGFEIHGPYDVSDILEKDYVLLIRDFFNPRPVDLWPQLDEFSVSQVKLLTLYQDIDINIDIFDHMTHNASLASSTRGFVIYLNGDIFDNLRELDNLNQQILSKSSVISEVVEGMTKEEKVLKFIDIRYYGLRKLRGYFGEDWHRPLKVKERVKRWGLIEVPKEELGPSIEELRRMFDPWDDFRPKY